MAMCPWGVVVDPTLGSESNMVARNQGVIIGMGGFFAGMLAWLLLPQLTPLNKALIVGTVAAAVAIVLSIIVRRGDGGRST